jgi:hypothetical protein
LDFVSVDRPSRFGLYMRWFVKACRCPRIVSEVY